MGFEVGYDEDLERAGKRDRILKLNKPLMRARYNHYNFILLQNVEPMTNALTTDEVTDIICSSMGNAIAFDEPPLPNSVSLTEKYAAMLMAYNLDVDPLPFYLSFRPEYFSDFSKLPRDDEEWTAFYSSLIGDWGSQEDPHPAIESPHKFAKPKEMSSGLIIQKLKKMQAFDLLLETNRDRKRNKKKLHELMLEYESNFLKFYQNLSTIQKTSKPDIEQIRIELSIGYLLIALEEEGYFQVFINRLSEVGVNIDMEKINEMREKARIGLVSNVIQYKKPMDYVPLEKDFKATTADIDNVFASCNESNLEELINELSLSIQASEPIGSDTEAFY